MRLRNWWRTRGHNVRDINCIHWVSNPIRWWGFDAVCKPCEATGGYVAQRHAEMDSRVFSSKGPMSDWAELRELPEVRRLLTEAELLRTENTRLREAIEALATQIRSHGRVVNADNLRAALRPGGEDHG